MFNPDFASRLFAAVFALALTGSTFAYAIVPASPTLMA